MIDLNIMNKIIYVLIVLAIVLGLAGVFIKNNSNSEDIVSCTMEAKICPDGSAVGRSGPNCEFAACPDLPEISEEEKAHIASKMNLIEVSSPLPMQTVISPLSITGQARGYWFFEASAPVVLADWDGKIIAEGYVTAAGDWMTEDKVPFSGTLNFIAPNNESDPDFMNKGTLIFKKDNPSGLPEHDDALEIPVVF